MERWPWLGDALQFGHGGEAVETPQPRGLASDLRSLQFGHGGEAVETAQGVIGKMKARGALQFGHGGEAVETWLDTTSSRRYGLLQFGHGGEAVETFLHKPA